MISAGTTVDPARARPAGRSRAHRWWRRRPVRRALVLTHRWTALVLGVLLVVETTTGVVILYENELDRALHRDLYQHTASAHPVGAAAALALVRADHPGFGATWVSDDHGTWIVGNGDYATEYGVDPGTGRETGSFDRVGGVLGLVADVHDCALTCAGYPGYVPWLAATTPTLGLSALEGMTWGGLVLVVLGLLLLLLAVTGAITWWPGLRKLRTRTRVRTGRGQFARDVDLHNVVGIVAVPALLLWGLTGAAFSLPAVEHAWLTVTGGTPLPDDEFSFTPRSAAAGAPVVSLPRAVAAASAVQPGRVSQVTAPTEDAPYYEVDVVSGAGSYAHAGPFAGDVYVFVDPHDAGHVKASYAASRMDASTRLYEKVIAPTHFGWNVDGWWRIVWAVLGLTPLLLMATGVSTWLARRSSRLARERARLGRSGAPGGPVVPR